MELDTNPDNNSPKSPDVEEGEKTPRPIRELWFETSKGNNITLTCPKLPGSPPSVIEIHEPLTQTPGMVRKKVISTSGQLRLHNVKYEDSNTYYCSYFTEAAHMPTAKMHLNVYDLFGYLHMRKRRSLNKLGSAAAAAAHKTDHSHDHSKKSHSSQSGHHGGHDKQQNTAQDQTKAKGKDAPEAAAANNQANQANQGPQQPNPAPGAAAAANQQPSPSPAAVAPAHPEEKDANENYDGEIDPNADLIEPPSSPDVTQLSDNSVVLKWTSGALRDRGVKGYKVEYLKGNMTKVFGGIHNWHVVANRVKPRFRIFKVEHLQPEMSYRFRIATIYAGNKYIYGLSSGWIKMQRYS